MGFPAAMTAMQQIMTASTDEKQDASQQRSALLAGAWQTVCTLNAEAKVHIPDLAAALKEISVPDCAALLNTLISHYHIICASYQNAQQSSFFSTKQLFQNKKETLLNLVLAVEAHYVDKDLTKEWELFQALDQLTPVIESALASAPPLESETRDDHGAGKGAST